MKQVLFHNNDTASVHMEATRLYEQLIGAHRHDPHSILGVHKKSCGQTVIRVFRPGAEKIYIELYGYIVEARKIHDVGLFEIPCSPETTIRDYRVFHTNGLLAHDPYAAWPTFGEVDQYLLGTGTHYRLYEKMGARLTIHEGIPGVSFTVWAPSARSVSLIGDFNFWDARVNPMRSLGASGVWEIFVPGLSEGEKYKFLIETGNGQRVVKSDPYALSFELRPKTASQVADFLKFEWSDDEWMKKRAMQSRSSHDPLLVYEVHLGSWRKKDGGFLSYRELAHQLVDYCKSMHFTHIELLPVTEHPFDGSWGYQTTGYFAPTSRFGSISDFQYFVNYLHTNGIGVFLDWVPGHFPVDDFALARFDGTALYEHEDPKKGYHPHWSTSIFNFGRKEVSNFLLASALYWLKVMHIDGLRVDAVASMIYLDYGRNEGEWIPNEWGGKDNLEAIEFLKHLNSIVHQECPGVLTIAEESTAFPGITTPVEWGGIGFDLKWNMGWMNDTLSYFHKDPLFRSHHHNQLTFGLLYAFTERFQLVLSHDEVVHGKNSLLSKMPGDIWQKFANLRLLYSYMICQPGKKLLFMGGEIGQWNEWNSASEIEWFLLDYPLHKGAQSCVRELNRVYLEHPALWGDDFSFHGFEWVDFHDSKNSIISYIRKKPHTRSAVLCIHNFTPSYFHSYEIPLRHVKSLREIFNSDDIHYGGSGKVRGHVALIKGDGGFGKTERAILSIPPLATVMYDIEWE